MNYHKEMCCAVNSIQGVIVSEVWKPLDLQLILFMFSCIQMWDIFYLAYITNSGK